jgi:uncharacterized protein
MSETVGTIRLGMASADVVKAYFDESMEGDGTAVDRYFAQDAVYVSIAVSDPELDEIMPWVGVHHGREGVSEILELLSRNLTVLGFTQEVAFSSGPNAALFGTFRYQVKATGKVVASEWAAHAVVREGLIRRLHFYENSYALASGFRSSGTWEIRNHQGARSVPPDEPY